MYNWSVDEKKFKTIKEVVNFLKSQPEVISVKVTDKKDNFGNLVIKTKLDSNIHPAKRTFLEYYLSGLIDQDLRISIIEAKKLKKEIFE